MKPILNNKDLTLLLEISFSNQSNDKERDNSKKRLSGEIKEIGDNRDIFLHLKDGKPVAMVQLIYKNADNDQELANGKDIAHIHDLEVRKDLHGRGFGKQCILDLEEFAFGKGIKILTLGVDSTNLMAKGLYEKLGYQIFKEEEGRIPEEKLYLMKKTLLIK